MVNCYLLSQASAGWICVLALWFLKLSGPGCETSARKR